MQAAEAPVLFVIFNRTDTTRLVWDAIKQCKPKKLYVSSDGPRANKYNDDWNKITQNRNLLNEVDWECEVHTRFLNENVGCGIGVSGAISWAFEKEDKLIIIEDDCLPTSSFFHFCNEMLEKFASDHRIMHVSGTRWNEEFEIKDCDYFYTKFGHIWGWATWKRAWQLYDYTMSDYPLFLEKRILNIALCNNAPLVKRWKFLFDHIYHLEKKHTWDYQWQYAIFKHNGLSVNAVKNLVTNIGESGTHNSDEDMHNRATHELAKELKAPAFPYPEYGFDAYHARKFFLRDRSNLKMLYDRVASVIPFLNE